MKNNITRALSVIMSIIICISFTFGGNAVAIAETISGDASSDASSNAVSVDTDINNDVFTFKDKDAGVKVLVVKKNSWNDGYVADISIENTGSEPLSNWHIDLKVKGDIDSVWNSEYEIKDGKLTLSYPTWKRKINAGETYTIGMKVNGAFGDFEDFSYYEDAKDVSELYKIEYKVRNTWSHHAIIDAVITNTGETTLRDWSLVMDYDADIIDIWNADVVSNEGGSYRLKCKDYNADIKPDESVTFGFQAVYEGDEVVLPANSKLYAVADSKLVPTKTDKADWYKVMTNADSEEALIMRDNVKDRVKVAIIDSGVDYMGEGDEINRVDFIGDTDEENPLYDDRSGHGTGVAGMLVGVGSIEEDEEEEDTTEAEASDMDFSYLTDADYIEAVDVEDEEDLDEENEEDYDDEDYDEDDEDLDDEDYDDSEVYEDDEDYDDYDIEDESEENEVIEDEEGLEDVDTGDDEDDLDDDLNLFEYNDLYGDIEGLNPNIDLTSLRVLDEDNEAPVSRVIEAIEWAIDNDINILNLSWGVDKDNAELHNVIKRAYNKGMLIIAAAGNDGEISYPAKYDEVVAVGSVDSMAKIAASSASGDGIELVAPAEDVIAYTSFGILTFVSGTSYAAPQITALASLLWQQDITVSNKCIRELLRQSASPLGDSMCYGYGMADYKKAAGMYEEFVRDYVDNDSKDTIEEEEETAEVSLDEAEEVPTVDEEYVEGLWGNHYELMNKKYQDIKALKEGIDWSDKIESGIKNMTPYPEFHGGIKLPGASTDATSFYSVYNNLNYDADANKAYVNGYIISVDAYIEMMHMSKNMANTGMFFNSDYTAQEYTLSKRITDCVDKAVKTKYPKYSSGDAISRKASWKRYAYFVMGMALHTLGDYFAHQSCGLKEPKSYYYTKSKVNKLDNKFVRITHGIKSKKLREKYNTVKTAYVSMNASSIAYDKKIADDYKHLNKLYNRLNVLKKNRKNQKDPDFFDNRADNPNIAKARYSYTKKLYNRLIRDKVNGDNENVSMPSVDDYFYIGNGDETLVKSLTTFSKEKGSYKSLNRIKYLEKRFSINGFLEGLNISSAGPAARAIDTESVCEELKTWEKVNIVLDNKYCKDLSMKVKRISTKKKETVLDLTKLDTFVSCDAGKSNSTVYSFIGDSGCKYSIAITAKVGKKTKKLTKMFVLSDAQNVYEDDYKYFDLHCGKKGEKNKTNFKYNTKYAGGKLGYTRIFGEQSIYIEDSMFKEVSLSGTIVSKSTDEEKPLSGVKVILEDSEDVFVDKYTEKTNSKGEFLFDKKLYPGIYKFTVSKDGYTPVSGRVFIRSDSMNWLQKIVLLPSDNTGTVSIFGIVRDASTGRTVSGVLLDIYKGIYDYADTPCSSIVTDSTGSYSVDALSPGYYTVVSKDNRDVDEEDKYIDGIKVILVCEDNDRKAYDIDISKSLSEDQIRIVLTWGAKPNDLDAHLICYKDGVNVGECSYSNKRVKYKKDVIASLDVDNTYGYGRETITITKGNENNYRYYVKDFTNKSYLTSDYLGKSDAKVQVYTGSNPMPLYSLDVPAGKGIIWDVLEYNGSKGTFSVYNTVKKSL